ncbi:Midasin [Couchioplanes caeruleus]|uniref:Midasin n=1 Tax=Couchioplanes caeruleus TaxID=56438 RepID=UPI0020BF42BB|nr:Midasin [Couchioplanes caeruleus]UQU62461.1 Midasin [Couchioplanes caeruleus]
MSGTAMAAKAHKPKPAAPAVRDSDHDGMPDRWEKANGLNARRNDARADRDRDGLRNLAEYRAGTSARTADTDHDGMPDGWEVAHRLRPTRGDAGGDLDGDGLSNRHEYDLGDDPREADSDHDGVSDGDEDSDDDGADDRDELDAGEDPRDPDQDDDGIPDGEDNAGTVTAYDAATGALTVGSVDGMTVTVTVTEDTEIRWYRRSAACPAPATAGDLTPGRTVHRLDVDGDDGEDGDDHERGDDHEGGDDALTAEKISLSCG